ncbi:MAG: hypothetical protein ACK44A_03650 [Roseateles sp.]
MTNAVATHRQAIVALMEGLPAAGVIHPEEPFAKTQAAFQAAYLWEDPTGEKQLRGWFVVRVRTRELQPSLGRNVNAHTWKLQGFMALNYPGSGIEWDGVVEQLRTRFRDDPRLGGVAEPPPLGQPSGCQVIGSAPVMFAGVLCHATQLELTTYAYF